MRIKRIKCAYEILKYGGFAVLAKAVLKQETFFQELPFAQFKIMRGSSFFMPRSEIQIRMRKCYKIDINHSTVLGL